MKGITRCCAVQKKTTMAAAVQILPVSVYRRGSKYPRYVICSVKAHGTGQTVQL
jgi:hypothetical protein